MSIDDYKKYYQDTIVQELMKQFGYSSVMQVPRLKKITLNMGLGEAVNDKKIIASAINDLTAISGQKAVQTLARVSEAGFKIREGWPIGAKVTLRGKRMYDFLSRLINIAIPRIRDFRGFSPNAFDGRGNYNMGLKEQTVFPEIVYDEIDAYRGMDIAFTISSQSDEESRALFKAFKFPFRDQGGKK